MRRWPLVAGTLLACRPAPSGEPVSEPAAPEIARPSAPAEATPEPEPKIEPKTEALPSEAAAELLRQPSPYQTPPEGWPAELPWVSDPDLGHTDVETSETGDVRVRWSTPSARLGDVADRLLSGLAQAGYTSPEPCALHGDDACRLRVGDRLVILAAGVSYPGSESTTVQLHLLPAGHRPLERLPGRCVVPPSRERMVIVSAAGLDQEGEYRQAESRWSVSTSPGPDLDGDGVPEVYVPRASKESCPWSVPHDVYVMRGSCGHRVGTIVGMVDDQTTLAPFVKGLRTIHTTAEWAAYDGGFAEPNHHTRSRRYEFNGSKLRKESDEEQAGKCHHCGVEHCQPQ